MKSIAQLTAGARRGAAARDEGGLHPAPPGPGARPVPPPGASREGLVRLLEVVAPRLGPAGLTDKDLRALRVVVTACRWEDFTRADRDPVCFRQQQHLAAEIGVTPGYFRKIEAKLEREGLLERRTCENGHRGRLAPGPDAPVAGLCLAPLLRALPRLEALATAMAGEARALAEARALVRIERRAARRATERLVPEHPARAAYDVLRGAGFQPVGRLSTRAAIEAHLEALRAVIATAPAPEMDAVAAGLHGAVAADVEGPDDTDRSGAPRVQERCHTEDPRDPQTGSWSDAPCRAGRDEPPAAARDGTVGSGQEKGGGEGRAGDKEIRSGRQGETRRRPDGPQRERATRSDETARRATGTGPIPPSRLPAALLDRLTPRVIRDLGSEELRFYTDGMEAPGRPVTLRTVERAALLRRRDLGITPALWEEIEESLGWIDALVALIVVDRNRTHPTNPVRNPGGFLRDLARRRRAGALDLGASVTGVWSRESTDPLTDRSEDGIPGRS